MDIDEQLIEEVRSHKILYDLAQADYKNLRKKEYAWREVAAAVKLGEEECRKRWQGLRDSYKRCKRAEQIASGSAAKRRRKGWRYFDAMSFVDNVTSSRQTIGNISYSSTSEEYNVEALDDSTMQNISCFSSEEYNVEALNDSSDDVSPSTYCSSSIRETKKTDSQKFQQFLDFAASSIADTCGAVENAPKKKKTPPISFLRVWQPKLRQPTCHQVH